MTVPNTKIKEMYEGNGINKAFPITFSFLDKEHIYISLFDKTGKEHILTSDYFIDTIANIVYYPGYPAGEEIPESEQPAILSKGEKLLIYRRTPRTQNSKLPGQEILSTIEGMDDKCMMVLQELSEENNRAVKAGIGSGVDGTLPTPIVPGAVLGMSEDGTSLEWGAQKAEIRQSINDAKAAKEDSKNAATTANSANRLSNEALDIAESSNTTAGEAKSLANEALGKSNNAVEISAKAQEIATRAEDKIDAAVVTANEAKATAEGTDGKATEALTNSQNAVTTANTALTTANGIDSKATTAINNSKDAQERVGILEDRFEDAELGNAKTLEGETKEKIKDDAVRIANQYTDEHNTKINAHETLLKQYAKLHAPIFTGNPKVPTPATNTKDSQIANALFTHNVISEHNKDIDAHPSLAKAKTLRYPAWTSDYGTGEKGHIVCSDNEEYIGIIECKSFTVPEGVTINVGNGLVPTVIKSQNTVSIEGNINGVGRGALHMDGVGSGSGGGSHVSGAVIAGYNGLFYGVVYTKGGTATTNSAAKNGESVPALAIEEMVRLGTVGIGASGGSGTGTSGGGAGLLIVAPEIYISGKIDLSGKNGGTTGPSYDGYSYGGGGGGALLTASKIYQNTGEIVVKGGNGAVIGSSQKRHASGGGAGWVYNYVLGEG